MRPIAIQKSIVGSAFLAAALFTGITGATAARRGAIPPSSLPGTQSLENVQQMVMPEIDVAALLAADLERENSGVPLPMRYAKSVPLSADPAMDGTWETLADGSRLWRLRIESPGALSLSLAFNRFDLPAGASLWVHDPDGARVQGPYTAHDRNAAGGLWTAIVRGDELVAELQLPKGSREADIEIGAVHHGYRPFREVDTTFTSKDEHGECNNDVICPEGDPWRDQIRSVALISSNCAPYICKCTATLVNNTAEDDTPYLLTTEHCIETPGDAPSLVAYWNFQSPICGAQTGGSLAENQSGSTLVATWSQTTGSGLALLELDREPNPSFNVYYAGWDAREDATPSASVSIHHPRGEVKSISFDDDPPMVTSGGGFDSPGTGNYWRVGAWEDGTTEVGSSGGCLFDEASGLCIGNLVGGDASCSVPEGSDWFGRMSRHFTGGGTPNSRLSDWLDPLSTGTLVLAGKNAQSSPEAETWLIPAVASLPGKDTSNWKSQIAVVNPRATSREVSVFFVAKAEAWPGTLLSGPHQIEPNESLFLDDPLLPQNPTSGLIYVTVDGPGTVAFARTYNLVDDGSTFGQGQPGILLQDGAVTSELVLPLIHSGPDIFRTNVGLVQTSGGTYTVKARIYSSDGEMLAQKNYTTTAAWRQINDIFNNMGIGDQTVEGGWIRITLTGG